MNIERRKQTIQVVVLIVLLVGLGFSMWHMLRTVQGTKPAHTQQVPPPPSSPTDRLSAATAAPPAQPAAVQPGQPAGQAGAEPVAVPEKIEMNPNLFRVYRLSPAKNPFKQEERWYKDQLAQVPGYPELRDSKFLETMSPVVPDLGDLLSDDESWQEVKLTKSEPDKQYSITGSSEDDSISTQLTYMGPPGRKVELDWHPGSGVPLSALSDPSVAENFAMQGGQMPAAMPPSEDLFQQPGGEGLKIPGIDEVITGGVVPGDQIYCHGISVQDGHAYALVSFNGTTRLVQQGDSLPPRYKVQAITGDGAVLLNLRTEETQWLPVRAPVPQGTSGGASSSGAASGTGISTTSPQPAEPMFPVVGSRH